MTEDTVQVQSPAVQTYRRLSAPFDHTFTDVRGGVELTYLNGEQVISRLNEVLGLAGWNFRVLEHGLREDADEYWVLGELSATIDGQLVIRHQFGSDKIQRSRSTGVPLDIGFDLKSAATDCLKKCATLIGVGLYLSEKKPQQKPPQQQRPTPISRPEPQSNRAVEPRILCQQPTGVVNTAGKHELCGTLLQAVPEKGWTIPQLANEGNTLCRRTLCWGHYQEQLRRQAS